MGGSKRVLIGCQDSSGKIVRGRGFQGDRMTQKRGFNDLVFDCTVEAGLIDLIGLAMIQIQMGILVMGYQAMDQDLRRNTQREQGQ